MAAVDQVRIGSAGQSPAPVVFAEAPARPTTLDVSLPPDRTVVVTPRVQPPAAYLPRADLVYLKGDQGLSAYQLAVLEGFKGSEAEWLASLGGTGSLLSRLSALAPASTTTAIAPFAGDAPGVPTGKAIVMPGFPLALDRESDQAVYARADTHDLCFVFGLAQVGSDLGAGVFATRLYVSLSDWSAPAGTAALSVGRPYFLAPAGGITLEPPAKPDSVCNVRIGEAITPQTLVFGNHGPIVL